MADLSREIVGTVAQAPFHDGDGYSWGGDIIVSMGGTAINLGSSQNYDDRQAILSLANLIAAVKDLHRCAEILAALEHPDNGRSFPTQEDCAFARAALAKAQGGAK